MPGGLKMRKQVLLFSLFPVSQIPFITLFCFLICCLYCLSPSFFSPGDSLPPLSFSTDTHHSGASFLLFASMLWADETLSLSLFWTAAFTQLHMNRNITLTLLNNSVSDFSQQNSIGPEFQHSLMRSLSWVKVAGLVHKFFIFESEYLCSHPVCKQHAVILTIIYCSFSLFKGTCSIKNLLTLMEHSC